MGFLTVIIVFFVIAFGLAYGLSFAAKRQVDVVVTARPDEVVAVIEEAFARGMLWQPVRGAGTWNFECRGFGINSISVKTKPVISIEASDHGQAGVLVQIWMSEFGSAYGQVGCADRVVLKRRKVVRQLKKLGMGVPVTGMPPASGPPSGMPAPGPAARPNGGRPTPTFGPSAGPPPAPGFGPPPPGYR